MNSEISGAYSPYLLAQTVSLALLVSVFALKFDGDPDQCLASD